MPKIKEYSPQVGAAGPLQSRNPTGADFGGVVGQGLEALGGGIDRVYDTVQKHLEYREISDTTAKMSEKAASWTEEFQKRIKTAQPGDPNFVEKFKSDYSADIDGISEGISTSAGRKHFEQIRSQQQLHFMQSAIAGQAELVKEKAILDRGVKVQGLANMVAKNPDSLDYALTLYHAQDEVDASLIGRENVLKLNQRELPLLHQEQVMAKIRLNPEQTKTELLNGVYGDKVNVEKMVEQAEQWKNAQDVEKRRLDTEARRIVDERQEELTTEYMDRVRGKGSPLAIKEVLNSKLDYHHKEYIIQKMDQVLSAPPKANPGLWNQTYRDINEGKITTVRQLENLMDTIPIKGAKGFNLENLMKHLQGTLTPEGRAAARQEAEFMKLVEKQIIGKGTGLPDPESEEIIAETRVFFDQEKERLKSENKPTSLLWNPNSPEYFFNKVVKRSQNAKISAMVKSYGKNDLSEIETPGAKFYELKEAPTGLSPQMKRYNYLLKQQGGDEGQLFGPAGEVPKKGLNKKIALEAERLNQLSQIPVERAMESEKRKLNRENEGAKKEEQKKLDDENEARRALGMAPVAFSPAAEKKPSDKIRRPDESLAQWKERVKGK